MHRVGDGWECGDVEVYEEHRAVEILVLLLHDLRLVLASAAADAPLAIGGSIEGDCYDLPTRMVELTMRELGWRASSLGASLPFPTLVAAVRNTRPDLIWLSISQFQREQQLIADVSAFYETLPQGTSLVIGGRAVTSELRQQLRATVFCDNLQQMSDFASTIYKNRSRRGNN
jgi:methanogenic corrinoid protein MtbC1